MSASNFAIDRRRRQWLSSTIGAGVALFVSGSIGAEAESRKAIDPVTIKIVAQKFKYTPNEISVKKGQATILEFTSLDFIHGFSLPDLKIRADLVPGRVTKVELKFDREGVYEFLCDNFCGDGHEEMGGKISVTG